MTAAKGPQHDKDPQREDDLRATAGLGSQALAPRLRAVHVGLRSDLEVSRHLFRGAVSYIIRDPMTFQSQRLDPADYEILVALDSKRGLSEIFDDLRQRKKMTTEDEERFYEFVMHLHRLGFLRLPISDDKLLFRRYRAKRSARRKEKLLGFLFLRIPLWNPDAFLERTIGYVRPLFGRLFFALWLALMVCAGWVVVQQWHELSQPMQGLLAARNLPLIWITLIVLKIFHELGHAYACKHLGGHVPEMGAYLIVFTPCAYMDATACWGFTSRRDRLIVCLAGMYVESIFAALAVFIWSSAGPSMLRDLAYNVIFLAGAVTVLFNINPLMRYDGYYVMSDLTEVPNLRQRSTRYVLDVLKRIFLSLPLEDRPATWRLRALLFCYGVSAAVYRAALMLAIAALLASKMFVVGMMLAVFFVASGLLRMVRKLMAYLWYAEETAPMRRRAVALGLVTLIVLPALAVLLPVPTHVQARGILISEHEAVIRAKTAGFLERSHVEDGDFVREGDLIVLLGNDTCLERIAATGADLQACLVRRDAYLVNDPARALQEQDRARACATALAQDRANLADLSVYADQPGRVFGCLEDTEIGLFVPEGAPIATIASGSWRVQALLSEDQITTAKPGVGDRVEFRGAANPWRTIEGVIAMIAPAGSHTIELSPLTHLGGGDIAVDPITGEASQTYFEVTVDLLPGNTDHLRSGMSGVVRLDGESQRLANLLGRRLLRFLNRLLQE